MPEGRPWKAGRRWDSDATHRLLKGFSSGILSVVYVDERRKKMKKACAILTILLFVSVVAMAQPVEKKKWEFSTAISYSNFKYSSGGYSYTEYVLNIPLRLGYFAWKGLEIEPEIMLTKWKGEDMGWLLGAGLAYNFATANKKLVPFVRGGIGFGNGFSYLDTISGSSGVHCTAPNLGAGLKYLVGGSAALRLEYRFTHNHLSGGGIDDGGSENVNSHLIFIGISVFF
jgi:opacity protein-like surface antigen